MSELHEWRREYELRSRCHAGELRQAVHVTRERGALLVSRLRKREHHPPRPSRLVAAIPEILADNGA